MEENGDTGAGPQPPSQFLPPRPFGTPCKKIPPSVLEEGITGHDDGKIDKRADGVPADKHPVQQQRVQQTPYIQNHREANAVEQRIDKRSVDSAVLFANVLKLSKPTY